MSFDAFLEQAWADHAARPEAVAQRLQDEGLALAVAPAQVPPLANLAHHVCGEHLGRWAEGVALLQRIAALPACGSGGPAAQAVARCIASLELSAGLADRRPDFGASDRIRITALAGGGLVPHDAARASALLLQALAEAQAAGLADDDPAHRALAVTANNMACALEEKADRSAQERELMIQAAQAARRHWERAGTWLEVERAEYRLAMTWLQAGDTAQARRHAQACLETVQAEDAPALERFFAWEALGRVERHAGNGAGHALALQHATQAFHALEPSDQGWCLASLDQLAAVG